MGPGDAQLGAWAARHRRSLGAPLVRSGGEEHRFRSAGNGIGRLARRRPPARRPLPTLLSAPGGISDPLAALVGSDQLALGECVLPCGTLNLDHLCTGSET